MGPINLDKPYDRDQGNHFDGQVSLMFIWKSFKTHECAGAELEDEENPLQFLHRSRSPSLQKKIGLHIGPSRNVFLLRPCEEAIVSMRSKCGMISECVFLKLDFLKDPIYLRYC